MNFKLRAFKGLMLNFYYDLRKAIIIGSIITLSLIIFNFLMTIIFLQFNNYNVDETSGVLVTGFGTMLITLFVYTIISTSKNELFTKLSFPINRKIYAITNFISILIGSLIMLMVVTIITPIEIFIFRLTTLFTDRLIFINAININNYLTGFISSWFYMLAIASITYCIFMYIRKYTLISLSFLGILLFMLISFGWLMDIIKFIFLEQSLLLLVVKLIIISIISHVLGYLPLKRLEVM